MQKKPGTAWLISSVLTAAGCFGAGWILGSYAKEREIYSGIEQIQEQMGEAIQKDLMTAFGGAAEGKNQ